ncbi:MAG: hypothetical protein WCA35_24780 [Kovacikia sp.]
MLSVAAVSTLGVAAQAVQAGTELPMSISMGEGMFSLVAPDFNTTHSAYGGRLRVYDVHIAKMFEVTYSMCQSRDIGGGTSWAYSAGDGSIDMGTFNISCNLANDIALAYGLGKPERTVIQRSTEGYGTRTEVRSVPILDITGGKIGKWMGFTQRFKPAR